MGRSGMHPVAPRRVDERDVANDDRLARDNSGEGSDGIVRHSDSLGRTADERGVRHTVKLRHRRIHEQVPPTRVAHADQSSHAVEDANGEIRWDECGARAFAGLLRRCGGRFGGAYDAAVVMSGSCQFDPLSRES